MSTPTASNTCTATKANGQPCKAFAIRGSDPPLCAAHSRKTGAPTGNTNRQTHGLYAAPDHPLESIEDIILDMLDKQARLSTILDQVEDPAQLAKLLAIHGQNASRLGRLLRDQRALSGDSTDGLLNALGTALDELSTELGINGEKRFRNALRRTYGTKSTHTAEMPQPDDPWGAWVEYRLGRLEDRQTWLTRLILAALVMQVGLKVVEMVS